MNEFWRHKSLSEMSKSEWEALCDGCGRCCLVKLREEEDDEAVHYTDVACKLLDLKTCRCRDYGNRQRRVSDCVALTPDTLPNISWLPPTCAYRKLSEGDELDWWHPLVSGTFETVREAGVSVRGRVVGEGDVKDEELDDRIVAWPRRHAVDDA